MTDPTLPDNGAVRTIENAKIASYETYPNRHRPLRRGGNRRAKHSHVIKIGDQTFSFLAPGSRKWAYKSDTVSFSWQWDQTQRWRNIVPETLQVFDEDGEPVQRGDREPSRGRASKARGDGWISPEPYLEITTKEEAMSDGSSLPEATLSARGLRSVFGNKRPGDPSIDQTQEQIYKYYRNAKEGDPAVVRQTFGSSLSFIVMTVIGSNPRLGRVYLDQDTAYGGRAYYIKSGKNCLAPKGQTSLVVPTEAVLDHARQHPNGEIIWVDYGTLKRV